MDTNKLTQMLKQLGWGSGFRLPIANEENKKLEQLLEEKQNRLLVVNAELQEVSLAVDNSTSFVKHFNSNIRNTKELEAVKCSQREKEKQITSLAERERAKVQVDLKELQKQLQFKEERNKQLEGDLLRRKINLNDLMETIQFDKKAISAYEEKFSKEDAYTQLIEEFTETDNGKLKKCKEDYQNFGELIVKNRHYLDETISHSAVMEHELEFVAKRFRQLHAERSRSIENWKDTLKALEKRDKELVWTTHEYKSASINLCKVNGMLAKQEAHLENIQHQTKSYLGDLDRTERKIHQLHTDKRFVENELEDMTDMVAELHDHIIQCEKEMRKIDTDIQKLNKEDAEWVTKLEAAKADLCELQAKREIVSVESLTSSDQYIQLEEFLEAEEKRIEALNRDMTKHTELKTQREREMNDIIQKLKLAEMYSINLKTNIATAKKKSGEAELLDLRTKAAADKLQFKMLLLLSKLRDYESPQALYTKDEFSHMQMKFEELKNTLEDIQTNQAAMKAQIVHCEHVDIMCQKELHREEEQKKRFEGQSVILYSEITRMGKENGRVLEIIKDINVNNSLLQVQVRKMLHFAKNYESKLLDLEQERVTIETVVKARRKDIEAFTTLLQCKKRTTQEETQKLKGQCHEVWNEAQFRKQKYEMIMLGMWNVSGKNKLPGEDGKGDSGDSGESNTHSEAYFIIKMAQEREYLRHEGNKWDERVKEAEKVVEGLQNTLALMMGTNEAFKESLKPAEGTSQEGQLLQNLKQKELDIAISLKFAKERRRDVIGKLQDVQEQLDDVLAMRHDVEFELMEKRYKLQGLIAEIDGQKSKIQRATLQANKLVREISKMESLDTELIQSDLRMRVTREKLDFAVTTLTKLLNVHPQLIEETMTFLDSKSMGNLAGRVARKLLTPSASSTPTSGRSTPAHSVDMLVHKSKSHSLTPTQSVDSVQSTSSQMAVHKSSMLTRKTAVIFETLTGTAQAQKILGSVRKSVFSATVFSKKKSTMSAKHKSMSKKKAVEQESDGGGAINFGELRQALKDAVDEQQTSSQLPKLTVEEVAESETKEESSEQKVPTPTSRRQSGAEIHPGDSTEIIELVDNKAKFEEEAARHASEHKMESSRESSILDLNTT